MIHLFQEKLAIPLTDASKAIQIGYLFEIHIKKLLLPACSGCAVQWQQTITLPVHSAAFYKDTVKESGTHTWNGS